MQLASSSHDSIVYVCSLQNENSIATCEKLASHTAYVNCVRWSRDGKYLASASGDYNVKIWNARSNHCVRTLSHHKQSVRCVDFSPDGTKLISSSLDNWVLVWDLVEFKLIKELKHHSSTVWSCAWSNKGKWIISGGADNAVCLWNSDTLKLHLNWQAHTHWVRWVCWNKDDSLACSVGEDARVILYTFSGDNDLGPKLRILVSEKDNKFYGCSFHPNGESILVTSEKGNSVILYSVVTGEKLAQYIGHTSKVWGCDFNFNGSYFATCSDDHSVLLWNSKTGQSKNVVTSRDGMYTVMFQPKVAVEKVITNVNRFLRIGACGAKNQSSYKITLFILVMRALSGQFLSAQQFEILYNYSHSRSHLGEFKSKRQLIDRVLSLENKHQN